jgi:cell division protein FtsA
VKLQFGKLKLAKSRKMSTLICRKLIARRRPGQSTKHVAEIIEARFEEIFDLVNKELKYIGKDGQLPAGAILTGGGAKLPGIVELAKKQLRLPVIIGLPGS